MDVPARKKYLKETPGVLRHQAFGVLYQGDDIFGFAHINRDIDRLSISPPIVLLQFTDERALGRALPALKASQSVQFTLVDAPVFAYEPVLSGLKRITEFPLRGMHHESQSSGYLFSS